MILNFLFKLSTIVYISATFVFYCNCCKKIVFTSLFPEFCSPLTLPTSWPSSVRDEGAAPTALICGFPNKLL